MRHPCGAVPITSLHVSVYYCHVHQAWFARVETWHERDADDLVVVGEHQAQWGPFDDAADVTAWLARRLEIVAELPTRSLGSTAV